MNFVSDTNPITAIVGLIDQLVLPGKIVAQDFDYIRFIIYHQDF